VSRKKIETQRAVRVKTLKKRDNMFSMEVQDAENALRSLRHLPGYARATNMFQDTFLMTPCLLAGRPLPPPEQYEAAAWSAALTDHVLHHGFSGEEGIQGAAGSLLRPFTLEEQKTREDDEELIAVIAEMAMKKKERNNALREWL
jgi:hypothetical protein